MIIEGADRLLPHKPEPLGKALGEALHTDGIELILGMKANAARHEGEEFVLKLTMAQTSAAIGCSWQLVGVHTLMSIGLETVGIEVDAHGIKVDEYLRAGERLWATGDVTGVWPLTHVGEYEADVVADNIAGHARSANYEAVPRVTYTNPRAAAVGASEAEYSATALMTEVPKTATYTHKYAECNGFLTLLSDGSRLTGTYALGPEAGEWMQQATLAVRARADRCVERHDPAVPQLLWDLRTAALKALRMEIADMPPPMRPMDAQMSDLVG